MWNELALRCKAVAVCLLYVNLFFFFFSSRRRHTRCGRDWSSDVCSSDLNRLARPEVEQLPEATVRGLRRWRWAPQWLDDVTTFPAFLNPRWLRHILQVARHTRADVILCRDLPLAVPSLLVARRLGIPVVLDMAENYPAMLRLRRSTGRRTVWDNIVRNPAAAQRIERWVLPRVDGVLVVVEESRQRVIGMGVRPTRVVLVSNTPPLARVDR